MCSSLETEVLRDIWNPSAPILPFTLLIFECWSLACGEYKLLPLAVLTASFVMQCHLAFLLPSLGILGVGLIGPRCVARQWEPRHIRSESTRRRWGPLLRRWSLGALVVAVLCWSGPIADQALAWAGSSRGHGNLATLVDAAQSRETPVGLQGAPTRWLGRSVPPWWLRGPQPPAERTFEIFGRLPLAALVSSLVVLVGLAVLMFIGVRRRRRDVAGAIALALVLCAALGAVTARSRTPRAPSSRTATRRGGRRPSGCGRGSPWVWATATLWSSRRRVRSFRMSEVPTALAVGAVVAVGAAVAVGQGPDSLRHEYDPTRTVVRGLDAALPRPGNVRVDYSGSAFVTSVIHALRRRGATIGTDEAAVEFGDAYTRQDRRYDHIVVIQAGDSLPRAPSRSRELGVTANARHGLAHARRAGAMRRIARWWISDLDHPQRLPGLERRLRRRAILGEIHARRRAWQPVT